MAVITFTDCIWDPSYMFWVFPGDSDGKESACDMRDPGLIPGSGRSPGEGNGYPLQYSCLENPMDRRSWWATVQGVVNRHDWVSNTFTCFKIIWCLATQWHVHIIMALRVISTLWRRNQNYLFSLHHHFIVWKPPDSQPLLSLASLSTEGFIWACLCIARRKRNPRDLMSSYDDSKVKHDMEIPDLTPQNSEKPSKWDPSFISINFILN